MKLVAEYRKLANEYRKLSDKLTRPKDKHALELMARGRCGTQGPPQR